MPTSSTTSQHLPHANDHTQSSLSVLRHNGSRVTIFDIPLILDEILRHLTIFDLRNCQRVSKYWNGLCRPGIWSLHKLVIWGQEQQQQLAQQEQKEGKAPDTMLPTQTTTAWDLIDRNSALRSLSLENTELLLPQLTASYLNSLKQLTLGPVPRGLCRSLVDNLVAFCPFLIDLEMSEVGLHDLEMFRLVQSYVGLQRVDISIYANMTDRVIPTLIQASDDGTTMSEVEGPEEVEVDSVG
ncbi:hypothetical protein KI688_012640 [Linnemannia hyalina]|uniref:F-box domain-containing protein n=1 Tax=Linnemannia hyalina TaxID=64524 RepID=A0A9P8BT58_9FUNG|nr:hypothetical protein KI688_012640 [Linnemannia hyalina]